MTLNVGVELPLVASRNNAAEGQASSKTVRCLRPRVIFCTCCLLISLRHAILAFIAPTEAVSVSAQNCKQTAKLLRTACFR